VLLFGLALFWYAVIRYLVGSLVTLSRSDPVHATAYPRAYRAEPR